MALYNSTFSKIFGRSPIKPLQTHMSKVQETVNLLETFFRLVFSQSWEAAEQIQEQISSLEKEADNLKRDIRTHFPETLFLPVSRGDLLALLRKQDKIANKSKDIAGIVLGRKMVIPAAIKASYRDYLRKNIAAVRKATKAITELDNILESAFRRKELKLINKIIHELDDIEHETDDMQIKIREQLFLQEKELNPVDVIFLYSIIAMTGEIADKAQSVGNQLQVLVTE